jgi:heavy metal sensor kinase
VNTRSLKFRLVAWYAGWLALLYVIFGIFMYASLRQHLTEALRHALSRRARQVTELTLRSTDFQSLGAEIRSHFAPEANHRLTRVIVNGAVIYVSGPPSDHSFDPKAVPVVSTEDGESFGRRVCSDGRVLFINAISRTMTHPKILVEEGEAEAPLQHTLHAWLVGLVLGLATLIAVAVVGGYFLVHRALAPVGRITQSAERISSRNLAERLPVANTGDELERLSLALNHMICRLEESFGHTQRFLADASHELRTPLTMLRAEIEAVSGRIGKSDLDERTRSALEEVDRLRTIVEGLFALSRLDAGEALEHRAPVDLGELAAATTDQMGLLAQDKNIALICEPAAGVIVDGDRARLKQVLVNLLDNAIKFTPGGGQIAVRVLIRNASAVMEVEDSGIGIPSDALSRVFDRFFRVDRARSRALGGSGLGLSIVESICAAHQGHIRVQSREGHGSRFTIDLPLSVDRTIPHC